MRKGKTHAKSDKTHAKSDKTHAISALLKIKYMFAILFSLTTS